VTVKEPATKGGKQSSSGKPQENTKKATSNSTAQQHQQPIDSAIVAMTDSKSNMAASQ
jgi:hypothetical protein